MYNDEVIKLQEERLELSLKLVAIDLDSTLLRDDKSYDTERFDLSLIHI